ncbi:Acetyltransferase ataH [Lachnellula arida]|uniref:Acetyltransferase ataH n=1 Tax=Lachnellula arida TaxID=1316785 RepID=A0A8T9BCN7_9HELO|nr:Acetyltransferase ataH [Lachnellula arida]
MSSWSQAVLLNIFHIVSLLYIEKWPAPCLETRNSTEKTQTSRQRYHYDLRATYKLWGDPQLLSSNPDPETDSKAKIQPLSVFIFLRLIKLPIYYYLQFHLIPSLFSETIVTYLPEDVSPIQQTYFRRWHEVEDRELVIRGYTAITWIWESVVFLDSANSVLACFFVLVGVDEPRDWPSLFGNPASATSLRGFWSRFWHRLAIRPYSNYGKIVAYSLGLQQGGFAYKTIVAFVVFTLSGISHAAVSWQLGRKDWYLDVIWFSLNFLACSVEVVVLSAIRGIAKSMGWSRELNMVQESSFGKFVGFVWVFGFFFWSVPKWKYPMLHSVAVETATWRRILSGMSLVES